MKKNVDGGKGKEALAGSFISLQGNPPRANRRKKGGKPIGGKSKGAKKKSMILKEGTEPPVPQGRNSRS